VYYFAAVNKSYKTLENEEGMKRCREIIEEAQDRVEEMVSIPLENVCFFVLTAGCNCFYRWILCKEKSAINICAAGAQMWFD
jgi:hypothetical protein